jgi:hypothetical protein
MADQISNSGGTLVFERILRLNIHQSCDVAVREVPKRSAGEVLDKGTYIFHLMTIILTTRLTIEEKDTLFAIHDKAEKVTLNIGSCEYSAWLEKPDISYVHSKSGTEDRSWKTILTLYAESEVCS